MLGQVSAGVDKVTELNEVLGQVRGQMVTCVFSIAPLFDVVMLPMIVVGIGGGGAIGVFIELSFFLLLFFH